MGKDASGYDASGTIPVLNPATGEIIGHVPDAGTAGVDQAVAKARASFESGVWRRMPAHLRSKVLWRVADIVEQRLGELSEIEARDVGMSRALARGFISIGLEMFR